MGVRECGAFDKERDENEPLVSFKRLFAPRLLVAECSLFASAASRRSMWY